MTAGHLDLVALQQLAEELGFRCTQSTSEGLGVDVAGDARLCFVNLPNGDVLIGFEGTAWHMHPPFTFFGTGDFIEHDETTLLAALADCTLLMVESWSFGTVIDRWLMPARAGLDTEGLAPGQELRVRAADLFNAGD